MPVRVQKKSLFLYIQHASAEVKRVEAIKVSITTVATIYVN